jgi:putative inorganic carbon (hco3(-)) transporter
VNERLAFNGGLHLVRGRQSQPPSDRPTRGLPPAPERPGAERHVGLRAHQRTDWAWRGLILFTIVLFMRPQDHIPPLALLHLAEVFAIVGAGALLFGRLARGLTVSRVTPEILGLIAFIAAMTAGIPGSIWPGGSVEVMTDSVLKLLVIFVLLVNTLDRPSRIDRLSFLLVLLSGYVASRTILDWARGVHLVEDGRAAGAVGGIFGNPNDLALNMVVFLPFAVMWAFRDVPSWKRALAAGCGLAMTVTIVLTRSRGGAVGLIATIALLAIGTRRMKPAIAAAVVVGALVAIPLAPASFWDRMASITDASKDPTGSRQARIDLLKEGVRVFGEHPLLGVGIGQFVNYDPTGRKQAWHVTHNALLQVASETGIAGLLPFLFLLGSGAAATREVRRRFGPPSRRVGAGRRQAAAEQEPDEDRERLIATAAATGPSLAGWFVAAFFASVALNWTLYYVLAIAAATRDAARTRERGEFLSLARVS